MGEDHEAYEDIVEDKLFKFRYRQNYDSHEKFAARQERLVTRFFERAKKRDPVISEPLFDTFIEDQRATSIGQFVVDDSKFDSHAEKVTNAHREYMAREGVQQFRDYYETDAEEQGFFEYLDNLPNRDRIRFIEAFEDYTVRKWDTKDIVSIPKREFNPELSAFSNLILDLVDFKDRVRPLARDITLLDATTRYQARPMKDVEEEERMYYEMRKELGYSDDVQQHTEEKKEISEHSGEDAAVPSHEWKNNKEE